MPNLVPQTWRVPRESGNAGSDVSGESSHSRVNQLSGRREGWEQGWMTFLPLWPPWGNCFQKVLPTLGQVFPHPLKATKTFNLQLPTQLLLICGKLALKPTSMASSEIYGTMRKPDTASVKPRKTVERILNRLSSFQWLRNLVSNWIIRLFLEQA